MIKYTFFFNDGNLATDVHEDAEDTRIRSSLASTGILEVKNAKYDLYVNLSLVKCTAREVIDESRAGTEEVAVQSETSGSN